jgi:hypothetical protein
MDPKELATLIAAAIAAVAAMVSLVVNVTAQRRSELRLAHRKSLEPFSVELGDCLHQIIATSRMLPMTSDRNYDKWRRYGQAAQSKLKVLRPKLRYALWGADTGLRTFTRIPDWADHIRDEKDRFERLMNSAGKLLGHIDASVRRGLINGKPPTLWRRLMMTWHTKQCRKAFREQESAPDPELQETN